MPPETGDHAALTKLLQENLAVAKDNNRLLREMRRNAILGFIAKIVIWLVILGVPLFFLSTYLGPILESMSGQAVDSGQFSPRLFGIPSEDQINQLIEKYQATQE